MLTNNYRNLAATLLCAGNVGTALPSRALDGANYYISNNFASSSVFPYSANHNVVWNAASAGIALGSGTAAPSASDYRLQNQITSGLSATRTTAFGEEDGNPYLLHTITVTNNSSAAVTVAEVGYQQPVYCSATQGAGASSSARMHLIDRTLLDSPVTVQPGDFAVIRYKLQTIVGD